MCLVIGSYPIKDDGNLLIFGQMTDGLFISQATHLLLMV
jgi:hypothetical protein